MSRFENLRLRIGIDRDLRQRFANLLVVPVRLLSLSDVPDDLSSSEFWELFGTLEHERLDFKRGAPNDLKDAIPAMAMTDGGFLVLGVSDDRSIVGCPLSQNTLDRVTRYSHECNVEVQVKEIAVDEHQLTIVAVPVVTGRIVTTPDGRLLRRIGGDCQPLIGDAMARFVRARSDSQAEDETVPALAIADLDLGLVNDALRSEGRPPVRRADRVLRALVDLGVANPPSPPVDALPLRAAAVLFASEPGMYVPGATVQLLRRAGVGPGPGPSTARDECSGPLPRLLECALQFIGRHTRRFEVVVGTTREVFTEYPTPALREAILNALAHRDYGLSGATVDITVWDDRIEIRSPGPLPGHITVDNMREEHYSRNRRMMRVLKGLGLVEEYGEGVDRMFQEMDARLMEPPIFAATSSSVTVTLLNRFVVDIESQVWLSLLAQHQLSSADRRLLVVARSEGSVTPRRVRELFPNLDAEQALAGSVARGLLIRVGEKGGSRYILSPEVILRAGDRGLEAQSRRRQMLLDELHRRTTTGLATTEAASLLQEPVSTVRHLLNDLVRSGAAEARGNTRGRRYFAR